MKTIEVTLPDDVFAALGKEPEEVAREMRVALAVRAYARGIVSQGKAAEVAGLTRSEFLDALAESGVSASQETIEEIREALRRG